MRKYLLVLHMTSHHFCLNISKIKSKRELFESAIFNRLEMRPGLGPQTKIKYTE